MTDIVAPPEIDAMPPAPLPTEPRSTFTAKAFTQSAALAPMVEQVNASNAATYQNAVAVQERTTAAASSATAAAGSAVQASKLNLGPKSSPPAVDNQGDALLQGATYYDTTLMKWRAWSGSAWVDPVSVTAGVTSLNGVSGALSFTTLGAYGITDGVRNVGDQTIAGNKSFSNNVLQVGAGGLGYGPGSGGTVTQATSKSTAVTLNKMSGRITMNNAALAGSSAVGFYLYNSLVAATDQVLVSLFGGGSWVDNYSVRAGAAYGGIVRIVLKNETAGTLSNAVEIYFSVIKGAVDG